MVTVSGRFDGIWEPGFHWAGPWVSSQIMNSGRQELNTWSLLKMLSSTSLFDLVLLQITFFVK